MTSQRKARILFVDDEERIINLLRVMFRSTYEVFTAGGGEQALQVLQREPIDVIVSDQRMPGMLGVELLAKVRMLSPATVRVLLTGYADQEAIVGSVNEGQIFRFITKPWDQDAIRVTLAEAADIALMQSKPAPIVTPPGSAGRAGPQAPAGVLILDDNDDDAEMIRQALAGEHPLFRAASVSVALQLLAREDIGVMVCESQVGGCDTGQLLHALKTHFPALMTVMLARHTDADEVVRLINQARIYRFASKPIRPAVLQLAVSGAMKEHRRCMADSRHVALQRTVRVAEPDTPAARGLLQAIKAMTSRLRLFSA